MNGSVNEDWQYFVIITAWNKLIKAKQLFAAFWIISELVFGLSFRQTAMKQTKPSVKKSTEYIAGL